MNFDEMDEVCQCSAIAALVVRVAHLRSAGAVPTVSVPVGYDGGTSAGPTEYELSTFCSTNVVPVEYHWSANSLSQQYICSTCIAPERHSCGTRAVLFAGISVVGCTWASPVQYSLSAQNPCCAGAVPVQHQTVRLQYHCIVFCFRYFFIIATPVQCMHLFVDDRL